MQHRSSTSHNLKGCDSKREDKKFGIQCQQELPIYSLFMNIVSDLLLLPGNITTCYYNEQ